MSQREAFFSVLRYTDNAESNCIGMKMKKENDYWYVSFYTEFLFYEAYVDTASEVVCGLNFEPVYQ